MRTAFFAGIGSSGLMIVAVGCSPTTPAPPDGSLAEFCADYAKALCQISSGVCAFDSTACSTFQTSQCMTAYEAQVTSTRTYNQPNGKACIDALNGAYGGNPSTISSSTLLAVSAKCDKVVIGSQASGQTCTGDNDCSGGLVCTAYGASSRCGPVTQRNVGDPCADPGDQCQGDSYCAAQTGGAPPQCAATPAIGGACSATIPCGTSGRCVSGTCAARAKIGDACEANGDCATGYCDVFPPSTCTDGLSFGRGGLDCKGILGTNEPDGGVVVAQPEAGATTQADGGDAAAASTEAGD